ncbi:MAG: PEP-CTERM sorting domain-containing protein [Phycisphaeraceae bacterium]|nr:PEP-CTERM sorting domain-containing protein [Phycisphaeraceae bacterium]
MMIQNIVLNRKTLRLIQASLMLGIAASPALAEEEHGHFDISPTVEGGKIVSNGYSDDDGDFLAGERVFGYELGEGGIPGNETFAGDPGINVQPGAGWLGLPGLKITGPLTLWDGAGYAPVADPDTSLKISFGAPERFVTGTSGAQADIFIGSTHDHFSALLNDTSGDPLDGTTDPATGIYQFEAQIVSTDGSLTPSDTIWINFNYGAEESVHEAALEYTETVLVPEPSSALALLAGAGLLAARRRRH